MGKTTVCRALIRRRKDIRYSVSATSRRPRPGEVDGRDYFFLSPQRFSAWVQHGRFAEHAIVHGRRYGSPRAFIEQTLDAGLHVLMDIDVQGARTLMQRYPAGIYIFLMPPSEKILEQRLRRRNTDDAREIAKRLQAARAEMAYRGDYQYVVVNDHLPRTIRDILAILRREVARQPY